MREGINYIDVDKLSDLPEISSEKKYLEFLGGLRRYRCFIVNKNYSRYDFYNEHLDLIDKSLYPIYKNREISVVQNNTFAIPSFYIIIYGKPYKNITELPESLMIRTNNIIKCIRKIMLEKLKIKFVNIYYEEINSKSSNVCCCIMPKYEKRDLTKKIYEIDIKKYLESFDIYKTKKEIIKCNNEIKKELLKIDYKKFDDELYNKLETREKKINLCIAKHCFITCKGCYNNFCSKSEISYKEIKNFLQYAKSTGLERVTLSGGDPLTRKDLKKIIKECNKLNLKINLDTVGLAFTKSRIVPATRQKVNKFSNLKILKAINSIGIPLDGSNNDIISTFRIYKGNLFNEIIEELKLFDKLNIKVCINTVLHKQNINDIKEIYNILTKHRCVKQWQIFQFMSIGPLGSKNANLYKIDFNEFQNAKNKIENLNKNNNIIINFKSAKEREYNYMLVNSNGMAYKVDLNNNIEKFGEISDMNTWDNILNNLF